MLLKNKAEFEFDNSRETVKIEQVLLEKDDDGPVDGITLTLNEWIDKMGGSDGESVYMTLSEFQEFIDACQRVLDEAKEAE